MEIDNLMFKPITKGLGFDKTVIDKTPDKLTKSEASSTKVESSLDQSLSQLFSNSNDMAEILEPNQGQSKSISDMINSLPPKLDFIEPEPESDNFSEKSPMIFKPVGRADYQLPVAEGIGAPMMPTDFPLRKDTIVEPPKIDLSLGNSMSGAFPKMELHKKKFFHHKVIPQPQFSEVTGSFTSAILDFFVVSGIGTLFIVALVFITDVDLFQAITNAKTVSRTILDLGVLFFGVYLLYYMICRSLFGSSLGDWAFDVQLGSEKDREERLYPLKVLSRMLVIGLTGFITIPLISYFTKKDMAKRLSGLNLFLRNY